MINGDDFVAAYEKLRSRVISSSTSCSHRGLPLLTKEGIASWIVRYSNRVLPAFPPERPAIRDHVAQTSDELQNGIVRLLANMALAGRKEMRI